MSDHDEWTALVLDTKVYSDKLAGLYVAIGLAGEVGELLNVVKKEIRNGKFYPDKIEDELGDIMWYWHAFCLEFDVDPNQILQKTRMKLLQREAEGKLKHE